MSMDSLVGSDLVPFGTLQRIHIQIHSRCLLDYDKNFIPLNFDITKDKHKLDMEWESPFDDRVFPCMLCYDRLHRTTKT